MNNIHELTQGDQVFAVVTAPVLQDDPSLPRSCARDEEPQDSETCYVACPSREESQESEAREPLKELCDNDKESSEAPEQEQEQEGDNNDGTDKINDYVVKVLEKLVNQRSKMGKLSAILEKKGLISEKKASQIQNLIQELEETASENSSKDIVEDDSEDTYSKENLSPVRSKYAAKVDALVVSNESRVVAKSAPQFSVEDVLQISRKNISYGLRLPGQVVEEDLNIINKSSHDFVVQIIVSCLNDELQNTEEYVFSVRRSHLSL